MPEDYKGAARRHWRDAELLMGSGRVGNADPLYGFATECAIKSVLRTLGYLHDKHRVHVDQLWSKASYQSLQHRLPGLAMILCAQNPFQDWSVDQRYAGDDAIDAGAADHHKRFAARVLIAAQVIRV
jgi:hypothetical protein